MTRCKARVADWAAPSSGACVRGPASDRAGVSRTPTAHVAARGSGNPRRGVATWRHGGHICARAGGFTLLEVLLATGLAVTLLFGLWSLLGMQTRLYTAAPAQIEEGQLIRSLFLQLSDDLHNALHVPSIDPTKTTDFLVAEVSHGLTGGVVRAGSAVPLRGAATVAAAGSAAMVVPRSSGRPSALIGTEQSLRFQILDVIPPYLEGTPAATDRDTEDAPRVPELCQITYTFRSPNENSLSDAPSRPGLTRRAIAWEAPDSDTLGSHVPWSFRPDRTTVPRILGGAGPTAAQPVQESAAEPLEEASAAGVAMYVPEVVGIAFRYFDGSTWSSWWDSLERRSLPVAIEVTLQFGADDDREERPAQRLTAEQEGQSPDTTQIILPQDAEQSLPLSDRSRRGRHRFVVYLPASPRQAVPSSAREPADPSSIQP